MSTLTIRHTYEDGTTLHGTERGDAAYPIVKTQFRMRWHRTEGFWYFPYGRDKLPNEYRINELAEALRGVGFDVELDIDRGLGDLEEREQRLEERAHARAERLEDRAHRRQRDAAGAHETFDRISGMIPVGQPVLVGHHSQRRHERDLDRMGNALRKSVEATQEAAAARDAAATALREQDRRHSDPVFIGNRIKDWEKRLREAQRRGNPRLIEEAEAELRLWNGRYDALVEVDLARRWVKDDFTVGDRVYVGHGWCKLAKANAKTIKADTGVMPWPLTYDIHEVRAIEGENLTWHPAGSKLKAEYEQRQAAAAEAA